MLQVQQFRIYLIKSVIARIISEKYYGFFFFLLANLNEATQINT